jgi:hypothetical protein
MKLFSPRDLTRNAMAAIFVLAVAAPPHPNPPDEFGQLLEACLATMDPNSDECQRAQEKSGLSPEDFAEKLRRKLEPKVEKRADLWSLMKECSVTRDLESDPCHAFVDGSGMTRDQIARLAERLAPVAPDTGVVTAAKPAEIAKACTAMRASLNGKSAQELMEQAEKSYKSCMKASR